MVMDPEVLAEALDTDPFEGDDPGAQATTGIAVISSEDPGTILNLGNVETVVDDTIIAVDEDTMMLINTVTGEIVGCAETPPEGVEDIKLAEWIGNKRAFHQGQIAGLIAERQVYLDKISAAYDSRIKSHQNSVKFFELTYGDFLFKLAKQLIGGAKKRSVAVGLLMLKLTKTRAKVEITDEEQAISFVRNEIKAAKNAWYDAQDETPENQAKIDAAKIEYDKWVAVLKRTTSLLKSNLPEDIKSRLADDKELIASAGMQFYPGGEDELKIE